MKTDIVPEKKIAIIEKMLDENKDSPTSRIKERLGNDYSYAEIRAVVLWREKAKALEIAKDSKL